MNSKLSRLHPCPYERDKFQVKVERYGGSIYNNGGTCKVMIVLEMTISLICVFYVAISSTV